MELIDRQRLRYIWGYADHGDYLVVLGHEIMDAPVVDAVPIVYSHIHKRKNGIAYCSVCGANLHENYDAAIEEYHYCYSCGAKFVMEEKDNGT